MQVTYTTEGYHLREQGMKGVTGTGGIGWNKGGNNWT